jgi:hypothetical protein
MFKLAARASHHDVAPPSRGLDRRHWAAFTRRASYLIAGPAQLTYPWDQVSSTSMLAMGVPYAARTRAAAWPDRQTPPAGPGGRRQLDWAVES